MDTTEIERNLTSAILINSELLEPCLNRGIRPEMFLDEFLAAVWAAVTPLAGRAFDIASINAEHPELDLDRLSDLMMRIGSAAAIDEWIRIFLEGVRNRRIAEAVARAHAALSAADSDPVKIASNLIERCTEAISLPEVREEKTLKELAAEVCQELSEIGKTNVPWFDASTEGRKKMLMKKRQIVTIGAPSGTGKTEFSLSAVVKPALESGKRVLYICTESPASEIYARLSGMMSKEGTPYRWLNTVERTIGMDDVNDFSDSLTKSMPEKYEGNLIIRGSDSQITSAAEIETEMRRVTYKYGQVDLLVIDFLQDLQGPPGIAIDNPVAAIEYNVNAIKRITDKYGCSTLVNSQLNRTTSKLMERPTLYRLKGAGGIENKSHVVAFLWSYDDHGDKKTEFYLEKSRSIEKFSIPVKFGRRGYTSYPLNKIEHRYEEEDCING